MEQKVVDYLQNRQGQWQALLACDHIAPPDKDSPISKNITEYSKVDLEKNIGKIINCDCCDQSSMALTHSILQTIKVTLKEAWEDGGVSGLCPEGRFDLMIDSLNTFNLKKMTEDVLANK